MDKRLSPFAVALLLAGGTLIPTLLIPEQSLAACLLEDSDTAGNNPTSGQTVICANDLDNQGVNAPDASGVAVEIQTPSGGISVTGQPGVLLGNEATVTVAEPARPITTQGDSAVGIDVLEGATITINGVVSTSGETSPGISTGANATLTIDNGTVRTGGGESPAITVDANSTVEVIGNARVETGNSNADGVVLSGEGSTLTIGSEAVVTTSSGMSNPVQVDGANTTVNVAGDVRSSSGNATAILGTGQNIIINVQAGGVVTAQSSNSNAIEITETGAVITVENGAEVRISSGNSAAIISGPQGRVNVDGTLLASSSDSQGIVLNDGASLIVRSRGVIKTSSSGSQAVLIDEAATTAEITVERGGNIDAVGAQAIVDRGSSQTTVTVDGTVFGGSSEPVIDLGAGNDTVTVNGTVRGSSASPVISLGAGDDTLNDNSSQTIAGPGTLVSAGEGSDTLNISNGKVNQSSSYSGFETTNVDSNNNPDDPANGQGSTFNVDDNQSGNRINVREGSQVNVQEGGSVDVSPDNAEGTGSGQQGGMTNFEPGSSANVRSENRTGTQPTQEFSNTTFAEGTTVATSSGFVRGSASNSLMTGRGEIALESDFANGARTENAASFGNALNVLANETLLEEEQAALDELIGQAITASNAEALLSTLSGEVRAQTAASGIQIAHLFNSLLLPVSELEGRISAAPVSTRQKGAIATDRNENSIWVSGLGGFIGVDRNETSTSFSSDTYGIAVGYDRAISSGSLDAGIVGVGVGYSNTDVDGLSDSLAINSYSIGSYFEGIRGPFAGNVAASYSYQNIGDGPAGLDGDGNVFVVSSEGFYNLNSGSNFIVGPIGRLGAAFGGYSGFDTVNSALSSTYEGDGFGQFTAGLGVRLGTQMQTGAGLFSFNADLLYEGVLGDDSVRFDGQLANSTVRVAAPFTDRSGFAVGAQTSVAVSKNASIGLRYAGKLGDNIQNHSGELRFNYLF